VSVQQNHTGNLIKVAYFFAGIWALKYDFNEYGAKGTWRSLLYYFFLLSIQLLFL